MTPSTASGQFLYGVALALSLAGCVISTQAPTMVATPETPVALSPTANEVDAEILPTPISTVTPSWVEFEAEHVWTVPRLLIPSLSVDEAVVTLPIHKGGWDISLLALGIGWLETTGAFPGDDLAMVLAGHMSLTTTQRGPFSQLQSIKKGATVIYRSAQGKGFTYRVEEITRIAPEAVSAIYVKDGRSLLLLTCTDWDFFQGRYLNRLLVRATLDAEDNQPGNDAIRVP